METNPPKLATDSQPSPMIERRRLLVQGVVQGVGFRPFVYGLAHRLALTGFVGNDSRGVFIEIEGPPAGVRQFEQALRAEAPPLAHLDTVTVASVAPQGDTAFVIVHSETQAEASTFISPDVSICADCLAELFDPADRRYRYPFINCTNCGPRFTIIRDIPYDRPLTTMAPFPMCPACQAEYNNPLDRRFHAQPNACPDCGPQVKFQWSPTSEVPLSESVADPIRQTQAVIAQGGIVAVKGLGGFHLACDATNDQALQTLRVRKGRSDKPFAVMAFDLAAVATIAELSEAEAALLSSKERPILLLKKKTGSRLSALVAPGNDYVGVMLPYTPLHYLLLAADESPAPPRMWVMTSGNYTDEPIVKDNAEALERLAPLADAFLRHNREIHVQCDDSVVRLLGGQELPLRRSRGYAPFPVKLPFPMPPTLAVGGELKSTFCLSKANFAYLSQHIGDMENLETLAAFTRAVSHFQALFRVEPACLVCDLHPGYLSSQWARRWAGERGLPLVQVQHHHAHLVGLMAEHGLSGREPVIGFSFDGTGYGPDGTIWGGELLIADYGDFRRAAYLKPVPLPGGDAAIKRPYRTALAYLWAAGVPWTPDLPPVAAAEAVEQRVINHQLETGFNAVPTSSMGRLFDAVAALAGVRQTVTYEAQAAIEFEALAAPEVVSDPYRFAFDLAPGAAALEFDPAPLIQTVAADVATGVPSAIISARFHEAVADLILSLSLHLRQTEGLTVVALSGGVFQNVTLLGLAVARLQAAGFEVLTHRQVPPNDGGLALGQAVIAGFGRS